MPLSTGTHITTAAVVGGSVTLGHGVTKNNESLAYGALIADWIKVTFPLVRLKYVNGRSRNS